MHAGFGLGKAGVVGLVGQLLFDLLVMRLNTRPAMNLPITMQLAVTAKVNGKAESIDLQRNA